jgi:PAS domain S-box-containing protein
MTGELRNRHSLSTQLILSFICLVLLTATAAGLPGILIIREQLNRQAWAQIEQGTRAARALYAARQTQTMNMAALIAQRPTLHTLLAQEDQAALTSYLVDLQESAGFDMVAVCAAGRAVASYAVKPDPANWCLLTHPDGYHVIPGSDPPRLWLLASQPIGDETAPPWYVIVGQALDDDFALELRDQTGLEHALWAGDQPAAASLSGERSVLTITSGQPADLSEAGITKSETFSLGGRSYYAARFPLEADRIDVEVALAVTDVTVTQRRLIGVLIGSIVVAVLVASSLGALIAGRLTRPLVRLADAAATLSRGNLDLPVSIRARIREVGLVAQALEGARIDLLQTLTHLKRERDWADHLLESIVEGIVILDERNCISFFSPGAERVTGWQQAEVLQRSIDDVFEVAEEDASFSQQIPAPGRRQKVAVVLADGRHATLAITGARFTPPEPGKPQQALVFRDVSEEDAINRLLGAFMSNVAHEFRTPLSALAASIELLLDQAPQLNQAELQELLVSLHLGILGLQTLVDNLLEAASIEARRFRVAPRPSDLGHIIGEAVQMMEPLLKKYDQRLAVELPTIIPEVQADPRRTVQVLVNLLSNASKYGPTNAEIHIGAKVGGGYVRVSVADRGPGIPHAYRADVFRRFVRLGTEDDNTKAGAGLGLSVVKAVVEAQGGQVGAEDRPGGGAVFWFTVPLSE